MVLLFSGHMVDAPRRSEPRFPHHLVAVVSDAVALNLAAIDAGPADMAIASAAAGGDIVFLEQCLSREIPCQVHLPFAQDRFLAESVEFAGSHWVERFNSVMSNPLVSNSSSTLLPDDDVNPFERCNLAQLESALRFGPEKVRLIAIWDGQTGDGPGGTSHMVGEAQKLGIPTVIVEPRSFPEF